jgi:hypothetical protein
MQNSPVLEPVSPAQAESKPRLTSHDLGEEFSLEHLLELIKIVEREALDYNLDGYVFDDACLSVSHVATRSGLL